MLLENSVDQLVERYVTWLEKIKLLMVFNPVNAQGRFGFSGFIIYPPHVYKTPPFPLVFKTPPPKFLFSFLFMLS